MTCDKPPLAYTDKFLLTCLLRGMTYYIGEQLADVTISTHMPLARHDTSSRLRLIVSIISTHMPLARHDAVIGVEHVLFCDFYSHASCEA